MIGWKKAIFLSVVAVAIVAVLLYSFLYPKRLIITFSDDKIITGDGKGPYIPNVGNITLSTSQSMWSFQTYAAWERVVRIKFEDAHWMGVNLKDIAPRLPTGNYDVIITFGHRTVDIYQMGIGESVETSYVWITLYNGAMGMFGTDGAIRDPTPFDNSTLPREPAYGLYRQGHSTLKRTSQDVWVLDVDAWFTFLNFPEYLKDTSANKCYVRLSLTMTMNYRG